MTSTAADRVDEPRPSGDAGTRALVEPSPGRERGHLTVADQVVEKVAGHAVTVVPGAAAAPRRVLGVNLGQARLQNTPSVTADVQDGVATVQATIAVRWPMSVAAVADEVRRRIRTEVTSQTGVEVAQIDIDVVSMTFPDSPEPRVR